MSLLDLVVQSALQYQAASLSTPHVNYDAELEMRQDNLERAMRDWSVADRTKYRKTVINFSDSDLTGA